MSHQDNATETVRLLRQQAALARFGSYAFREPVLLKILNEAARTCAEGLDVPFCKICRYRPAENDLLIEAGYGWRDGVIGHVVSAADHSTPQGRAFITEQPVILHDLQDQRECGDVVLPAFYAQHGIISTIDVIIKGLSGEPYGVLEIDSAVQHDYDQHDVAFLTGFANILAEAVATSQRVQALRVAFARAEALVVEKDMLAEELKHRVRNNLQLISGMLDSHLRAVAGPAQKVSVMAMICRVMTLAEVYEQLLGTGLGRSIDLGEYINAVCKNLPTLQNSFSKDILLSCRTVTLPVDLDTVTAIGMIVAETVSNSYEHAFPNGSGLIDIELRRAGAQPGAVLTISDDGPGFTEVAGSKRHGIGLVRRLMQQLDGSTSLDVTAGTRWTFRFPTPSAPETPAEDGG
ncbi:histidine kinase dimerization/phosphoacceptor domain -containing protein [Paeniroseomonas aquatica]|uniref:histidine kinase dimerization/phosphoacceptor domain -containing protein n=1 Tax=Paeniroseomonas aquatica TaxID=373043 RepID=UPI00362425E0